MGANIGMDAFENVFGNESLKICFSCDSGNGKSFGDLFCLQSNITVVIKHSDNLRLLWRYTIKVHKSVGPFTFGLFFLEIDFESVKSLAKDVKIVSYEVT